MKNCIKLTIRIFCILLASINYSLAQTEAKGAIQKVFQGVSYIDISTISGSCEIVGSDGQEVVVELSYNYKPANTFEPIFEQDENVLLLEEKMLGSNSGYSTWVISVPKNIRIKFTSASGGMILKDVYGKIKVNTASGNIEADAITISGNSDFGSASGNVRIAFDERPKFDVSASSASGDATIDFNGNPVVGTIEMQSRTQYGKIKCPYTFDIEKEGSYGNQKYVVKSFTSEGTSPMIKIHTASGKAVLKK